MRSHLDSILQSQRQFAFAHGFSPQYLTKLIRQGMPVAPGTHPPKIDPKPTERWLRENKGACLRVPSLPALAPIGRPPARPSRKQCAQCGGLYGDRQYYLPADPTRFCSDICESEHLAGRSRDFTVHRMRVELEETGEWDPTYELSLEWLNDPA